MDKESLSSDFMMQNILHPENDHNLTMESNEHYKQ